MRAPAWCSPGSGGDGLLGREEILALELGGLVLLSACQASRGHERWGEDRRLHLGGSLLEAGARCVILARTDLELDLTLELNAALLAQLARGATPAEALRPRARRARDRRDGNGPARAAARCSVLRARRRARTARALVRIHEVQGDGPSVTGPGPFTIEAIVVGDFQEQETRDLRGFFVQEEDADADANPQTSEGIFVFCSSCPVDVMVGDRVRVTGAASEFFDMSQLSATGAGSVEVLAIDQPLPTPASIDLPIPYSDVSTAQADIDTFYEAREGMLVTFVDDLTVSEYFQLGRYGQIVLAEGGRPRQFTDENMPTAAGYEEHLADLAARRIILDDTNDRQNAPLGLIQEDPADDVPTFHPAPGFSVDNYLRGGDVMVELTGALHWSWSGFGGTNAWRIRPIDGEFDYAPERRNERSATPEGVGGSIKVAAFNVLNLFASIDQGIESCGPTALLECRGADSAAELERQIDKLVDAMCAIGADVVGLVEIENDATATLDALTAELDLACGPYAYVDAGAIGADAIKVALIYKADTVSPLGGPAVLATPEFTDPNNTGTPRNRAAIAQTFEEAGAVDAAVTVVVNHFKSKGSPCAGGTDPDDDDVTTGQGNCNLTRTLAAEAQVQWLATDPTGQGAENVLVIGDLNAYRNEDPIVVFENAGYTDLIEKSLGDDAYSFVFDGQIGYLDHALANAALVDKVTGVTVWHINADEVNLLDYNDGQLDSGEASFERKSTATNLYAPDAYRSSDHDPVIVGLQLAPVAPTSPVCRGQAATIYVDADNRVVGGPLDGRAYAGKLIGTWRGDVIVGTRWRDRIYPLSGDDVVCARAGNDLIVDGRGDDRHFGGAGNDVLLGGRGNDLQRGNRGRDILIGGTGRDDLGGGRGGDRIIALDGKQRDRVNGGPGRDFCLVDAEKPRGCEFVPHHRRHGHHGHHPY